MPGGDAQTIELEALPEKSGKYLGHLTIFVVNGTKKKERVFVTYVQDAGGRHNALAGKAGSVVSPAQPPPKRGLVAKPKQPLPIQLEFTLPPGRPASWLEGTIELKGVPRGGGRAREKLLVPVKATFKPLSDISFEPESLTVQITGGDLEGGAEVRLRGPGAEGLLDRGPPFTTTALLGNGEGNRVSLTLQDLRRGEGGDVVGTLSAGDADPGEYEGSLILGSGEGAPSVPVTLRSRHTLLFAILIVLLSAVIGGLVPIFTATVRARAMMRTRLKSAIERFEEKYDSPQNKPKLLWDMSLTMGPRPWLGRKWSAVAQVDGIAGLFAEVRLARNDDELDELGPRVDAAIDEIGRWLLVFGPASRLRELAQRPNVPARRDQDWASTKLAIDTEGMLDSLRRNPPKDTDAAKKLARGCIEQYLWHSLVLDAWTKVANAQNDPNLTPETRIELSHLDFEPILNPNPPASQSSPDQMTELAKKLSALLREARRHVPTFDRYAAPPTAETVGTFLAGVELADPESERPWTEFEQEADLIEDETLEGADVERAGGRGEEALQRLFMLDWGVTAVLAFAAAFAYTAPLYGNTWGTEANLLTAAAAGFGTQVVVQWGAMPIMRSVKRAKAAPKPAPESS